MGKIKFSGIVKAIETAIRKHSPEICIGIGIAGIGATAYATHKATKEAMAILDDAASETEEYRFIQPRIEQLPEAFTLKEKVQLTWKCYIPPVVMGVTSAMCIIGGTNINSRRSAALATAYSISETALKEYKDKVVETIGEKKERDICDAIAKDRVEKDPVENKSVIITGKGNTRCYDALSGQYFDSDIDTIKRAVNEMNRRLLMDGYISLNDFYDELGLELTKIGYDLGWHIDKGLIDVAFSSQISKDGVPCIVIDYTVAPMYDYDKWL